MEHRTCPMRSADILSAAFTQRSATPLGAQTCKSVFRFWLYARSEMRQNTIHWIKSISIEEKNDEIVSRGHFKPINSRRFLNDCHEYLFHLTREGKTPLDRLALGVPYQDKTNIARWSHTRGRDRRCRGNTWFIPYETIQRREKERPHPATFPVELAEWCIKLHGVSRVHTMLDPFLGIRNTPCAH